MSNAIEIRDMEYRASKTFEIHDLALSVPTGSMYGFLGPNGSGKTTTMRLIMGMLRPAAGKIGVLGGQMPHDAHPRDHRTFGARLIHHRRLGTGLSRDGIRRGHRRAGRRRFCPMSSTTYR